VHGRAEQLRLLTRHPEQLDLDPHAAQRVQRLPAQRGLEAHLVQRHPDGLAPPGARAEEGVPERTREHGHA